MTLLAAPGAGVRRSAVWRFTLAFTGVFALAAALVLWLGYGSVSRYVERRIADGVSTDMKGFEDVFAQSGRAGLKQALEQRLPADPNRIYLLVDKEGELVVGTLTRWPNDTGREGGAVRFRDERGRSFDGTLRALSDGSTLLLAHDRAEHDAILKGLFAEMALPALAALALALLGGFLVSRRILRQVAALNHTCRAVEAGDLTARAARAGDDDEFGELARNVNAMLARIDRLVGSVQHLSDHIAHETRTPLARLRARLERARAALIASPEATAAIDDAISETQTIISIFAALLDITAAEAAEGDGRGLTTVDLAEAAAAVVDLYEGVAEDRGVTFALSLAPAPVLGEPMLLTRMLANVVDNAVKFSPEGGVVTVTLTAASGEAILSIADQGPGIAEAFGAAAFERFSRADSAHATPGHGLGLPLVRAIALRHGMKVSLEAARPPPGLDVIFRAPLAPR